MPTITIDGREFEAQQGQTVLQVALQHGIDIPHFCYHPRLKVAGNCRMCLVEIEKMPKLQISCGTNISDGMIVHTNTEKVLRARRAVMEFMLLNHPLDCPICDQCGECRLQDYSFEHGRGCSRFREDKHTWPKLDIGPLVEPEPNRCIHCTRCIRYLRDVAGVEEFGLHERGCHSTVGTYVERELTSPFQMNVVELCPVGALTNKPYRFKGRVWFQDKTRTVCPGCSIGCNVFAWSLKGKLLRFTPAENAAVNRSWLCDAGRMSVYRVHAENRLRRPTVDSKASNFNAALDAVVATVQPLLEGGHPGAVGVIASPQLCNEDNYLIAKLAREVIGTEHVSFLAGQNRRPLQPSDRPLPEWLVSDDKTPNTRGARDMRAAAGGGLDVKGMLEAAKRGELKALLLFADDLSALGEDVSAALGKLDLLMFAGRWSTPTSQMAHAVIPLLSLAETEGTLTSERGRVQRVRAAIPSVGRSLPAWQVAQALATRLGADWRYVSAAAVFDEIADEVTGYSSLSHTSIPADGIQLGL